MDKQIVFLPIIVILCYNTKQGTVHLRLRLFQTVKQKLVLQHVTQAHHYGYTLLAGSFHIM